MKKIFFGLILLFSLSVNADWSDYVFETYMVRCVASGLDSGVCRCIALFIEKRYPYDSDIPHIKPADISEAVKRCNR